MIEPTVHNKKLTDPARDTYLQCLVEEGVQLKKRNYYVMRLNQFLAESPCLEPASLREHEITALFTAFGRRQDLHDWQFAQLVDAVRIYFAKLLKSPLAEQLDWQYWSSSARTLSKRSVLHMLPVLAGVAENMYSLAQSTQHETITP